MPLLKENVAIREVKRRAPKLRMLLPEVLTIDEALRIALGDFKRSSQNLLKLGQALEKPI